MCCRRQEFFILRNWAPSRMCARKLIKSDFYDDDEAIFMTIWDKFSSLFVVTSSLPPRHLIKENWINNCKDICIWAESNKTFSESTWSTINIYHIENWREHMGYLHVQFSRKLSLKFYCLPYIENCLIFFVSPQL